MSSSLFIPISNLYHTCVTCVSQFLLWISHDSLQHLLKFKTVPNISGMQGVKNKTLPWRAALPKGKTQEWNREKSHLIVFTVSEQFPEWAVSQRVSLSLCASESGSKSFGAVRAQPPHTDRGMVKEGRQGEEKKMLFFSVSCHPPSWWASPQPPPSTPRLQQQRCDFIFFHRRSSALHPCFPAPSVPSDNVLYIVSWLLSLLYFRLYQW